MKNISNLLLTEIISSTMIYVSIDFKMKVVCRASLWKILVWLNSHTYPSIYINKSNNPPHEKTHHPCTLFFSHTHAHSSGFSIVFSRNIERVPGNKIENFSRSIVVVLLSALQYYFSYKKQQQPLGEHWVRRRHDPDWQSFLFLCAWCRVFMLLLEVSLYIKVIAKTQI